jgi:protein-L-isoaspartate(D-aspartate) O-methyltransferase
MTHTAQTENLEALYETLRDEMVEHQIQRRSAFSARLLQAMRRVPRHEFVPVENRGAAYTDQPLPIGDGQTISQPFIVAAMSEALCLTGTEKVLEVGTGSGYQAAVLSLLAREVHTVELHSGHAEAARARLVRLGYAQVTVHCGDGSQGLPEHAPFDGIIVTAAAPEVPAPLVAQLIEGRRLVIPVGDESEQRLLCVRKLPGGQIEQDRLLYCRFVPLRGAFGWKAPEWMHP